MLEGAAPREPHEELILDSVDYEKNIRKVIYFIYFLTSPFQERTVQFSAIAYQCNAIVSQYDFPVRLVNIFIFTEYPLNFK